MTRSTLEWRTFLVRLLGGAGVASLGAGVIFFVAANWQDYGVMGRFALLQVALAVCVGLAFWRPPPAALGQAALVLATLVAGALLALFGQTYQTGADVYELFFIWAVLALPFAVASKSGAVWGTWWTVLNVGFALYCGLKEAERALPLLFACLINFGGAVLFTHWGLPRWVARVAAAYGFIFGTAACITANEFTAYAGFAVACLALGWDTMRRKVDVFPMAGIMGSWIAISTVLLVRWMKFGDIGSVLVLAAWLIGVSSGAGMVLMRWVREWRAA